MTAEIWPRSTFDTYFAGDKMVADRRCRVQIGGGLIEVTYAEDDGTTVRYSGRERGEGHFDLAAPEVAGKATLHRFPNDKFLEGYWCEGQVRGMWQITLAK